MAKVSTMVVFHTTHGRDYREINIEVVGEIVFMKVGKSTISLSYEKFHKLIQTAAANSQSIVRIDEKATIVPSLQLQEVEELGQAED